MNSKNIIDCLKALRPIPPEVFAATEQEAQDSNVPLEQLLVKHGVVSETDLVMATAEYMDLRPISLSRFTLDHDLLELMDKHRWQDLRALPIAKTGNLLTVAMADPFDLIGRDTITISTQCELIPVVALSNEIEMLLESVDKKPEQGLDDLLKDMVDEGAVELGLDGLEGESLDDAAADADEAPVIRIVNSILIEALRKGASDIHIEPMEKTVRLRNRVDGVLYESSSPPKNLQNAIISRLKIMSQLDIAERRIPQDGRFKIKALGKEVDIRMSILPTVHGEKIVMRILDKSALVPSLEALNLDQLSLDNFEYALAQPYGMILVTGPTGSGKTTTLYSALQELNDTGTNIITTENPVEYQLEGINQVQINPAVGLTFASALRSILRQDPDVVMVGEIRDKETATIAVEAALTGHMVLSTLHTNDAAGAIARLVDMGIEPFMLASSLLLTQAQRLYRKLCPVCKKPMDIPTETLKRNRIDPATMQDVQFYERIGCPKCNNIGYKGRGGVMEILLIDDILRNTILTNSEADAIKRIGVENGMRTLREAGLDRVREGLTSIEEIMRVTSEH
ncbi:GspE/PulE family protein [Pontiella agarivorans]|uniref:ATPase, T2SS/T4P/T4SS family n=1 Tax=Pontiella agarivorans TaxID=3038953 RepID=A0ABU5MYX4_9BACT|nr:ATPase, T2SS/T4P/T4SS family [Pontiella agarivorans]MDZ8119385.1 ATPase, T2SS/T4P/T4SS family [Pontiella agarivorans]